MVQGTFGAWEKMPSWENAAWCRGCRGTCVAGFGWLPLSLRPPPWPGACVLGMSRPNSPQISFPLGLSYLSPPGPPSGVLARFPGRWPMLHRSVQLCRRHAGLLSPSPSFPAPAAFPEWVSMTGPYPGIQSHSGEAAVEPWGCFRLCQEIWESWGCAGVILWAAGLNLPHRCLIPNGIKNRAPAKTNKHRFYPAHSVASPPIVHVPSGPPTRMWFLCVS